MSHNPDFKDLFKSLNAAEVEYLIVGAHAVVFYSEPCYTKDLNIWVNPTPVNAIRVYNALRDFGAPLKGIQAEDFTREDMIFQIGVAPNRIDILMGIKGVVFAEAWPNRKHSSYDTVPIAILGKEDLVKAKRASNRPQDQLDLTFLT